MLASLGLTRERKMGNVEEFVLKNKQEKKIFYLRLLRFELKDKTVYIKSVLRTCVWVEIRWN